MKADIFVEQEELIRALRDANKAKDDWISKVIQENMALEKELKWLRDFIIAQGLECPEKN